MVATFALLLAGLFASTALPASVRIWAVPAPDTSLDPPTHLNEFSERWASHLAETGEFVHRNQRKILRRCDLTWVGETLVRGTLLTPTAAVKAWLHSPEHRAVIMKPRANRAGVGVRLGGGEAYAVLNFGDVN